MTRKTWICNECQKEEEIHTVAGLDEYPPAGWLLVKGAGITGDLCSFACLQHWSKPLTAGFPKAMIREGALT